MFEIQIGNKYEIKVNTIKADYLNKMFKEGKTYVVEACRFEPNTDYTDWATCFVRRTAKGFAQINKFTADIEVLREVR